MASVDDFERDLIRAQNRRTRVRNALVRAHDVGVRLVDAGVLFAVVLGLLGGVMYLARNC